ncbi:MAG TPA: hypothetical protein VNF74_02845 [Terriglobales bacterium]|nr:hypothetical protein [Terriglobales bacterium]
MAWTYAQLAAAYNALSPVPASLTTACATLNAQTTPVTADTGFIPVMGILYARGSWKRVQQVATGALVPTTLPSGTTAAQVAALCQMLVDGARPPGMPLAMSIAGINSTAQADLATLAAAKLGDGKGVIWAAGELTSGDPGDAAVLMAELVNLTVPTWQPAVDTGSLWISLGRPVGMT